jgi:hypothetical protein
LTGFSQYREVKNISNELVAMPKDQFEELLRDVINVEIEAHIGPPKGVIAVKQKVRGHH